MDKNQQLKNLRLRILKDESLPLKDRASQLVFGEGNPNSSIYLIGEAPGETEDKTGKPFVGRAGKLLEEVLNSLGIKREDVYISNIVKYRPPKNRPPTPSEISAFSPFIDEEINIIDPKVIVTLGRFSLAKFLPQEKISLIHGDPRLISLNKKPTTILPMYHPSAALRSPDIKKLFLEDFRKNAKLLNLS